jgi:hypothetical protein
MVPVSRRWVVLGAVVVLLACLPATAASLGGQAQPPGTPAEEPTGAIPLPQTLEPRRITLVEQSTFAWPGSVVALAFTLADTDPDSRLDLTVHRAATSRIQFGQTLAGSNLGPALQTFADLDPAALPIDDDGAIRFGFAVADDDSPPGLATLVLADPGVYPVSLRLTTPGRDDEVLVTHLVRVATEDEAATPGATTTAAAFAVSLLVELSTPTTVTDDGTVTIGDAAAANLGATAQVLAGRNVPTTLLARPATLDALAVRDERAGTDVVAAAATAAGRGQILGSTWEPVDAASLLDAGLEAYVNRQVDQGARTLARRLNATDLAPGTERTWLVDRHIDPAALAVLARRGVSQVIVPEQLAEPLDTRRFNVTLTQPFTLVAGSGGSAPSIGADIELPAVQTDLVTSAMLVSSAQPALAANRTLADLAMLAFDLPDVRRGVVVQVPGEAPVADALDALLAGLAEASAPPAGTRPLLAATTVEDLFRFAQPVSATSVGPAGTGPVLERTWRWDAPRDLGDFGDRLASTDERAEAMVSTVLGTEPAAQEAEATVAAVEGAILSAGTADYDADQRERQLGIADDLISAALAPIGIPAQGTVTLTADEGIVPVVIENGRADPARVVLELVADKLDFPEGNIIELVLEPGSNRIETVVRTRATGAFPIELEIRSPEGDLSIATGRFTVRSTAVSGLGLGLSIVAGLFLAAWWARNLRSTHRRRQLVGAEQPKEQLVLQPDQ